MVGLKGRTMRLAALKSRLEIPLARNVTPAITIRATISYARFMAVSKRA